MAGEKTKQFEGWSPTIYKDSVGKRTIGYGFNLDDPTIAKVIPEDVRKGERPMNKADAEPVFQKLYTNARADAIKFIGQDKFNALDSNLQESLTDLSYNLGYNRLSQFKNFKAAVLKDDYAKAADQLKSSKWYKQVGNRSKYHVDVFKTALNTKEKQRAEDMFEGQEMTDEQKQAAYLEINRDLVNQPSTFKPGQITSSGGPRG